MIQGSTGKLFKDRHVNSFDNLAVSFTVMNIIFTALISKQYYNDCCFCY